MSSTFGSLMNITPLICLSVDSMLGFSCSNEKVTVKFYCNTVQFVVPLCAIPGLYTSLMESLLMCEQNDEAIPLVVSSSIDSALLQVFYWFPLSTIFMQLVGSLFYAKSDAQ
jgi:hypothetical protein